MKVDKQDDALQSRVANLRRDLAFAEKNLNDYRARRAGIQINDIVEYEGVRYKIRSIHGWAHGVDLIGSPMKKDGTFGSVLRRIFGEWRKVSDDTETKS